MASEKIWCQTVHEIRQEYPSYGMDVLCLLFDKSRQTYYERSRYVASMGMGGRNRTFVSSQGSERFSAYGKSETVNLSYPKLEVMNIQIGRDNFMELLYRNFMLVRRTCNRRKITFSNHWMHKYPNLIRNYTPESPDRLWVSDTTRVLYKDMIFFVLQSLKKT